MIRIIAQFEARLRINNLHRTSDILRARAVYTIAFALVISQLVNLANMTNTYGRWTFDHWIATAVSILLLGSVVALRYTKAFYLFAGFYSLLLFAAIAAASLFDYTGINSALLPYLLLGSIVCGFISGWRTVVLFGCLAMAFIWGLYSVSVSAPQGALYDPALFTARHIQRVVQMSIILGLTTAITSFASYAMHSAFDALEENARQARSASEAKPQFMSDISHELRTPLNGIIGMSEILQRTGLEAKQWQYVKNITRSSQNLFAILEDAMDISKLDEGRFKLAPEPFNLPDLLCSLVDLHTPAAANKGLLIGHRYPEDMPENFIGDQKEIRKIINNLLSNALKFTDKGSAYIHVSGTVDKTGDSGDKFQIFISVQDTGIGIAPENVEKIFTRFCQLDTGLSRKYEGTGLGLSLSKNIAKLIGGDLTVLSRPNEGSTFTLELVLPIGVAPKAIAPPIDFFHPPTEELVQISHDPEADKEDMQARMSNLRKTA